MINEELKKYIENNILPEYEKNDEGHRIDHIEYVIRRSLNFAKKVKDINLDMVYTIAAYHDITHHINPKTHEIDSAKYLKDDKNLREFFTEEEINIMSDAVADHRASNESEPRTIYGKIVSSADRNTILDAPFKRTYAYRLKNSPDSTLEQIIKESYDHLVSKFGNKGYAKEKMYFEDLEYKKFLSDLNYYLSDYELFKKEYKRINNIKEW